MDGEFSPLLPAQGLTQLAQKQITIKDDSLVTILISKYLRTTRSSLDLYSSNFTNSYINRQTQLNTIKFYKFPTTVNHI